MLHKEALKFMESPVTYGEIKDVLINARRNITNWNIRSNLKKDISIGQTFNNNWNWAKNYKGDILKKVISNKLELSRAYEIVRDFIEGGKCYDKYERFDNFNVEYVSPVDIERDLKY